MDVWSVIRIVTQIVACLVMILGAVLVGTGLKKDNWKTAVKGLFLCMMGIFSLLLVAIDHIKG